MHKTVLAIDFDDTIAHGAYPELGKPKPNASFILNHLRDNKNCYIIIWTCREGTHVEDIRRWCVTHKIPYDQINEHHPSLVEFYKNDTRKIMADIYIDDKCLFKLPDNWEDIYQLIVQRIKELHETKKCLNI